MNEKQVKTISDSIDIEFPSEITNESIKEYFDLIENKVNESHSHMEASLLSDLVFEVQYFLVEKHNGQIEQEDYDRNDTLVDKIVAVINKGGSHKIVKCPFYDEVYPSYIVFKLGVK